MKFIAGILLVIEISAQIISPGIIVDPATKGMGKRPLNFSTTRSGKQIQFSGNTPQKQQVRGKGGDIVKVAGYTPLHLSCLSNIVAVLVGYSLLLEL